MAITAGATAQVGALAAAVLSSVHPAPPPLPSAFEADDGLSGPEDALLSTSEQARLLRAGSSAAKWLLDAGDGRGVETGDEMGLKRAIDEAKDQVVYWRSRAMLVDQIADSSVPSPPLAPL